MEACKIIQRIIIFMVSGHNVSSLIMQTEDVAVLQEDNSIILNCTYQKDLKEDISDRNIRWQKQEGGGFKDLAIFSPPGGATPYIHKDMQTLYQNRTELIAPNTSLAAVMIIKDPICRDVGKYQCVIVYYLDSSDETQTSVSVVEFNAKAREPDEFLVFPCKLEENQSIRFTCRADVGSPRGNITIWKISKNQDIPELIFRSYSTNEKPDNCTEFINVTFTVTRDDNGASFRCSSQNNLTRGLEPSKSSQNISVLYGPYKTTITLSPNKSMYTVGESLTIQCITDSNPLPAFKWYFRPNGSSEERPFELTQNTLVFDSLQVTDSGTYICMVVNEARSNSPNATSHVSVFVKRYFGCNQCRYIEICQQNYGEIDCIPNDWVPIALVFMILSVAFAVSSIVVFKTRKKSQENITPNHMNNTRSHPYDTPEDDGGGYWSPTDLNRTQEAVCPSSEDIGDAYSQSRDLIKMQERSMLLTNRNEPDGYTTTEDVVQYAAVQKKSTKDQVSDENVYDSAWNSDVLFQLRQEAQGPHRSPEQQ